VGWSRSGTRPEFQIVTGVSAGALIAPLAFAGGDWDPKLAEAFSGMQTQHLMRMQSLGALFGTSVYRGRPLAQLVDRYVTTDLVNAVARESSKGRLLLIATTDLDREQTVIWNLGLIAQQGGPKSLQLFRDVLIASASIPGIFPPMMIKVEQGGKSFEEMHVDGSAMTPLLFIPYVAAIVPTELAALHDGHLYVLVNGGFRTAGVTTHKRTLAIVKRSAGATMQGGTRAALEVAYSVAQRHQMHVAVAQIPATFPYYGALDFNVSRMETLFRYGQRCAQINQLWIDPFDALDQPPASVLRDGSNTVDCAGAPRQ
jgi:Patatin-like phospholipase